ncbi:AfsR/SARP family transcriptional regulator [Streptomyces sp. SM14]|uniref:AfsR/SARP family transcriptional regulator n=1 Tax=Streptomyces sp. SM14 TaxID=1736045 RepID=UPI0015E164E9|nr:AfsR/SARP family transcriptional regulator [Streptomyces sp. SM14]
MQFRVLGTVEVRVDGVWTGVSAAKQRHLLAVLLLHRQRVVPVSVLIEELWPVQPPATARVLVRNYVMRLRRILGDADGVLIEYRSPGYRLYLPPGMVDSEVFHSALAAGRTALEAGDPDIASVRLDEALHLWRGEPLQDLPAGGMLTIARESLTEARELALDGRIDAQLPRNAVALLPELRTLASRSLREYRWGQLMRALWLSGSRAEALGCYSRARRMLVERHGMEPGPYLRDLHEQMLRAG